MISGINQSSQISSLLFARLDTKSQGYIEKTDLASAFSQIADQAGSGSASVDDVFSALDSNSDGKVTKDEFSSVLARLQEQLDSQFSQNRMSGMAHHGGPPPPPPTDDAGFTKDELSSQIAAAEGSDNQRTDLMATIVANFEAADTNSDGKVSFQEAMTYDQSTQAAANTASSDTASSSASTGSEAQVLMKILQLMHAYRNDNDSSQSATSTLSAVA